MKRLICMLSKEKADLLSELSGFNYMTQEMSGKTVYTFMESKEISMVLQDKKCFGKRDFFYDAKLRFNF